MSEDARNLSESERRAEIDMRVGAKLLEREFYKQEYVRGFCDCLYISIMVAMIAFGLYAWNKGE